MENQRGQRNEIEDAKKMFGGNLRAEIEHVRGSRERNHDEECGQSIAWGKPPDHPAGNQRQCEIAGPLH
ncbi:MAG: hypothetical protein RL077_3370 [Verrucomicrobiota bacterium]